MHAASRQNRTTRTVYNSARHPEPQPGPILSLGGKERLKDARNVGCRNANSLIGDGDPHALDCRIVPVGRFSDADFDGAVRVDGLHRIQKQSREYLPYLAGIGFDRPAVRMIPPCYLNTLSFNAFP